MERQKLEKAYKEYIEELAQDALARKPVNQILLNIVDKVQRDIRDLDILEAMKKIRENKTMNKAESSENFTINEFGEIIRENQTISPEIIEYNEPMTEQSDYLDDYKPKGL